MLDSYKGFLKSVNTTRKNVKQLIAKESKARQTLL
eukprot:gene14091-21494_t